jgi:hypothetical protein
LLLVTVVVPLITRRPVFGLTRTLKVVTTLTSSQGFGGARGRAAAAAGDGDATSIDCRNPAGRFGGAVFSNNLLASAPATRPWRGQAGWEC